MLKTTLAILIITFLSCNRDDTPNVKNEVVDNGPGKIESLVFGSYAGFCLGDCEDIFKIDSNTLERGDMTNIFSEGAVFKSSFTYRNDQFEQYKFLLQEIPEELIIGKDKIYGCPDCADQGGFYFLIQTRDGDKKRYNIDTSDTSDQSEDILKFKSKITNVLKELGAF